MLYEVITEAPRNLPSIFRQLHEVGIGTLPIAALMALFVGMVLSLQTGAELALYGTQEAIGAIVGLSMVKELGPVMTSLLVAGRIGSAMAAEVGAMEVYEEIDALKTLEINPVRYLARITSYNVCYTKLLRNSSLPEGRQQGGADAPPFFSAANREGKSLESPCRPQTTVDVFRGGVYKQSYNFV